MWKKFEKFYNVEHFPAKFSINQWHETWHTLFSCVCRCHAVNVCDNAAYFYNKINEDLRTGGLDVKAEDIIDIIEGYKGKGYAISSHEELGVCHLFYFLDVTRGN